MRIVIAAALLAIALAGCAGRYPVRMTAARQTALHDCSVRAAKYAFNTWQTTQFAAYGTCMAQRHQAP